MGASSESAPLSPTNFFLHPLSIATSRYSPPPHSPCFSSASSTVSFSRYQQFSALRTTNEAVLEAMADPRFRSSTSSDPVCHCAEHGGVAPLACEECVQECADAPCTVGLTPECTDQCVVVPCNDAHHQDPPCNENHRANEPCHDGADCTSLEDFFECCTDFHEYFSQPRSFPTDVAPNTPGFTWDTATLEALLCGSPGADPRMSRSQAGSSSNPPLFPHIIPNASIHPSPATAPQKSQGLTEPMTQHLHHQPPLYLPSAEVQVPQTQENQSSAMKCMWGNCSETFTSLSELVGHVNLTHLRLPSPLPAESLSSVPIPAPKSAQALQQAVAANMDPNSLSCMWADCQVYPTPQSIPGPSTRNAVNSVMEVLASHLLEHHLGLPTRSSKQDETLGTFSLTSNISPLSTPDAHSMTTAPSAPILAPASPMHGPPTPLPEHDCSAPSSHICGWEGCGQSFSSCEDLTVHITATHVGGGKAHYDCHWEACSRHGEHGFASKQKILRHLQSHTGHRPFQCKICSQNFSEAATLAQHMRRHTQEKPYACDFPGCGKAFAITGALTIHKRTHNGHRPFKCTYCERAFAESSNLSKHLRTHTGARPYQCTEPDCAKSFARPDQLSRHMNVHRKKSVDETASPIAVVAL
ncbi:hypothetical protein BKA93DRAFT_94071 [Sparassis latifolia]|uniref:C2H2-type domain-containing protein n=1 Tax=Sparassis crispa TaxID=139825 RepID=A0A401GWK7_9APHY|nr:hypothetical protein SCP_0904870 [Sparassis crispa]GBE86608.1 hypothetical protein SCP_0904870 [Sparassis crispa]